MLAKFGSWVCSLGVLVQDLFQPISGSKNLYQIKKVIHVHKSNYFGASSLTLMTYKTFAVWKCSSVVKYKKSRWFAGGAVLASFFLCSLPLLFIKFDFFLVLNQHLSFFLTLGELMPQSSIFCSQLLTIQKGLVQGLQHAAGSMSTMLGCKIRLHLFKRLKDKEIHMQHMQNTHVLIH